MTTRAKADHTPSVMRAKLRANNGEACARKIADIDARLIETFEKMLSAQRYASYAEEDQHSSAPRLFETLR